MKSLSNKLSSESAFFMLMMLVAVFTLLPRFDVGLTPFLFWMFVLLLVAATILSNVRSLLSNGTARHGSALPHPVNISRGSSCQEENNRPRNLLDSRTFLLLSIVLWCGWIVAGFIHFGGFPIPPNYDAVHHINQISNIWRYNSLSLEAIYGNVSALADNPTSAFYPHGTHLLASGSVWIVGDPARGVAIFYFLVSQVLNPFGLYLMVRSFGLLRFWALLISSFGVSIGLVPYGPISWGGLPFLTGIVGLSFGIAWVNGAHSRSRAVETRFRNNLLWRQDSSFVIRTAAVVLGIGVIHPTAGLLLLTYVLILQARDKDRAAWWRAGAICTLALTVVFPQISFLPGAQSVRNLGEVDPSMGDPYLQIGQTLFLAPNSPFSYWHLILLPVVAALVRLIHADSRFRVPKPWVERGFAAVPNVKSSQIEAAILFVLYLWLLQVSALMTSHGSLQFLSWPTALWYRQIARTSYHLPMAIVLALVVMLVVVERSRVVQVHSDSRLGAVRTGAVALVIMIPVVGGLVTMRSHSSAFLGIGPISSTTYASAIQQLDMFQDEAGLEELFLISDFDSGVSLLSAGLGIPSSAEPYGRENVAGGVHSLISSSASLQDFSSFLMQWGDSVVVTNSRAPSSALTEEFVSQSGVFERVFQADGVVGWQLGKTAVRMFTDSSTRTDLYNGRVLSMSADGVIRIVVESSDAESFISTTFDVLQPTCALQEWGLDFSGFSNLAVSSVPIDSGVRLQVSGRPPVGANEYQLLVVSNGCQILGDTGAIKALVSAPVKNLR